MQGALRSEGSSRTAGARAAAAIFMGLGLMLAVGSGCGFLKKKKAFGEDCSAATDCESGECATYGSICSKSCTYDTECGTGFVCRVRDDGSGNVCSKAQGQAPNQSCKTPSECDHGHCLKRVGQQDQPGICSLYCQTPDDCPAGMKVCDSISDSGALKYCLPGGATGAGKPTFSAPRPTTTVTKTTTTTPPTGGGLGDTGLGKKPDAGTTPTPDAGTTPTPDAGTTPTPDAGTTTPDAGKPKIIGKPF